MSDSELIYQSKIHPKLTVMVIYPESEKYEILSQQFAKSGHAFLLHDYNAMMVDGATVNEPWFTMDHLHVIEAHEAGHYMAGHAQDAHDERNEKLEREADWLGYNLLKKQGKQSAAELHRKEYNERYTSFPEDNDDIMTHLNKYINESSVRQFIRSVIKEDFVSHSYEPVVGDIIINVNPKCKHHGSEGVVLDINELPEDQGKVISYKVTNDGDTYKNGDILRKTLDQLGPK